jgi:LAO/AO transport system kinase
VTATAAVADLVEAARGGSPRALARLVSLVEDGAPALREVMARLAPYGGRAHVVGITGPPGVGKSTTTSALVAAYRRDGQRVAVLAVDPSSPFSGGALLGDRIRMAEHALDPDVFVRSMASRGQLGGLSAAAPQAVRVLDAAGFDVVLLETVGVGQSEVEVARAADTTVVLLAPGAGDGVQAAKAGILEIGDLFVVNKADRDEATRTVRDLRAMLRRGPDVGMAGWAPPVIRTVATTGEGIDALHAAVLGHGAYLTESGEILARRRTRAEAEISALAIGTLHARLAELPGQDQVATLAEQVVAGELDPYAAADRICAGLTA